GPAPPPAVSPVPLCTPRAIARTGRFDIANGADQPAQSRGIFRLREELDLSATKLLLYPPSLCRFFPCQPAQGRARSCHHAQPTPLLTPAYGLRYHELRIASAHRSF